jgi:hypothetical protein
MSKEEKAPQEGSATVVEEDVQVRVVMRMDETDKFMIAMLIAFLAGMAMAVLGLFLLLGW